MMCLLDSCFLKKQVLYFHCSNLTVPSKFLARDPISDCCSRSRRRRASSRCCWPLNRHRGGGRRSCTTGKVHLSTLPFAAAKYSNDTSFYKWVQKKMGNEKNISKIHEVYFLSEAGKWPQLPTNNDALELTFRNFLMDHSNSKLFFGLWTSIQYTIHRVKIQGLIS